MRRFAPILTLITTLVSPALSSAAPKRSMSLYTMDCGLLFMRNANVYDPLGRLKGVDRPMANPCYLIRRGSDYMMWDVGLTDALVDSDAHLSHTDPPGIDSELTISASRTLIGQLATLHLRPDDIKYVGVASSVLDHTGNIGLFKHSELLIDEKEYAYWQSPTYAKLVKEYYNPIAWADGDKFARAMNKVLIPHSEPYDVFHDGTVLIYPAPGHTPGQRIVLVRLPESGPYLITGDVYNLRELRQWQLEGVTGAAFDRDHRPTTDEAALEAAKSQAFVEQLAKETGAKVILPHDFGDFFAMPAFPDALH